MKRLVVFLSGVATTITGAFIRSCESGVEINFANAWCGKAPPGAALLGVHTHCAGCAIAFAGLVAMVLAGARLLTAPDVKNAGARARQ